MSTLKFIQINAQRSASVTSAVCQLAMQWSSDILVIQEPYHAFGELRCLGLRSSVISSKGGIPMSVIVVLDPALEIFALSQFCDTHITAALITFGSRRFHLFNVYCQFNQDIDIFLNKLDHMISSLNTSQFIICMDSNAKSPLWFSNSRDSRGSSLEDFIAHHRLVICNTHGQPSTFWSPNGESNIDVTLATSALADCVGRWRVYDGLGVGDHRPISFVLDPGISGQYQVVPAVSRPRFIHSRADWELFDAELERRTHGFFFSPTSSEDVESMAVSITSAIFDSASLSIPVSTRGAFRVGWWTDELALMKSAVNHKRKALQRARSRGLSSSVISRCLSDFKISRNLYTLAIRRAKYDNWSNFVRADMQSSPWGVAYRISTGKVIGHAVPHSVCRPDGSFTRDALESVDVILDRLFPPDDPSGDSAYQAGVRAEMSSHHTTFADSITPFTLDEIGAAIAATPDRGAPGPDLITGPILRRAWLVIPGLLLSLYNCCLLVGHFPDVWKEASICLLLKSGDRSLQDPKSYRPISLLPVLGKTLERLMLARLSRDLLDPCKSSPLQFGFRPGLSTEDAVRKLVEFARNSPERYSAALFLDIDGAFDCLWWPSILRRSRHLGVSPDQLRLLHSYLSNRHVIFSRHSVFRRRVLSRGCPQGSILGPSLWNLVFDELLLLLEGESGLAIAYADDLVLVVSANSRRSLEVALQHLVDHTLEWLGRNRLSVSQGKSVAVMLRGSLDPNRPPTIRSPAGSFRWASEHRYLGVIVDSGLTFIPHAKAVREKTQAVASKLFRIRRALGGDQSHSLDIFYKCIFLPIVSYCASAWYWRLSHSHVRRVVLSAQRHFLLLISPMCRTSATSSLQVVTGNLPAHYYIIHRAAIYFLRRGQEFHFDGLHLSSVPLDCPGRAFDIRQRSDESLSYLTSCWQSDWEASDSGRCAFDWIPVVQFVSENPWFRPKFPLSCFISGHGPFNGNLFRLGLVEDELCPCGCLQSSDHILRECLLFGDLRIAHGLSILGSPGLRLADLISDRGNFSALSSFAAEAIHRLNSWHVV